ncbi:MAG: lipopolysaccharide heptosyltransferase II [Candidatus Aminicenantes bacterium]
MKIVVRAPSWIGDSVLALPSIASLKKNFPESQIWIAAKDWVKGLFTCSNLVEGVISLPASNNFRGLRQTAKKIKDFHFDIGLLLPNSFSSAILFYLAKIPQRWGYQSDGRGFLLTRGVVPQENTLHQVYYYLNLIAGLGLETHPPQINLTLNPDVTSRAKEFLQAMDIDFQKPLILFNPGAAYGPSKRWPAEKFAQLALLFQQRIGANILVIGSEEENEVGDEISAALKQKPINLAGKTDLALLAAITSLASLFVCNDTGPMHIANALRTPVVALFGPTLPAQTAPFQQPAVIVHKKAPCWPCHYRECPFDHRCMIKIEPEEVYRASQKFL